VSIVYVHSPAISIFFYYHFYAAQIFIQVFFFIFLPRLESGAVLWTGHTHTHTHLFIVEKQQRKAAGSDFCFFSFSFLFSSFNWQQEANWANCM
jgi:hypothetical protein